MTSNLGRPACTPIRNVDGEVRTSHVLAASNVRLEFINRSTKGEIYWHFRQPRTCLFWHKGEGRHFEGRLSGEKISQTLSSRDSFILYQPNVEIEGVWTTPKEAEYVVIFLSDILIGDHLASFVESPLTSFSDQALAASLAELKLEAERNDPLSQESANGWAIQSVVRLRRLMQKRFGEPATKSASSEGMTRNRLKRIDDFIRTHLDHDITIGDMAALLEMSPRHFMRTFKLAAGVTPHRHLLRRRLEEAQRMLAELRLPISEIALATGFSSSQHFANVFKIEFGITASEYRKQRN